MEDLITKAMKHMSPITFTYPRGCSQEEKDAATYSLNLYLEGYPRDLSQLARNHLDPNHIKGMPPDYRREYEKMWASPCMRSEREDVATVIAMRRLVNVGEWDFDGADEEDSTSSWKRDFRREPEAGDKVEDSSEDNGISKERSSSATELELEVLWQQANKDFWAAGNPSSSWVPKPESEARLQQQADDDFWIQLCKPGR